VKLKYYKVIIVIT